MLKFNENVVIHQPVEKVFVFAADLSNSMAWQTNILEIEQTSEGPLGPGTTYRCVNTFMGQQLETEGVISEYVTNRQVSITLTSGSITGISRFAFEPVDCGTLFSASGHLHLGRFRLAEWIVRRKTREQIKTDLIRLKTLLENGYHDKSD